MIKYALVTVFTFFTLSIFAQSSTEITEYLNLFDNQHAAVNNLTMTYLQYSVHSEDYDLIEQKRQELIKQLDASINTIKAVKPLGEDSSLKDEALNVYESIRATFNVDFAELLTLKMQSQNSYDALKKYFEARKIAEQKVDDASDRFLAAQRTFAEKHNIQLIEGDVNSDVKALNKLNNYHQAIMLRYFGTMMLNNDFMEAMNSGNAEIAEEKRALLQKESEMALDSLTAMPAFEEDDTYRNSAIELVKLFKTLSTESYPKVLKVMQMDATERKQEDVDAYNSILQKINQELPVLNEKVSVTGNELLKKYVPKPRETRKL